MKKTFFTFCMALMAVLALNAEDYNGTIVVTMGGITRTAEVTVTVTEGENGLYEFDLDVPIFGIMKMYDVHAATSGDLTVYSAERYVNNTTYGNLRTVMLARTVDGMMAANVTLPDKDVTMWFNTVGDHFQLPNGDMEAWTNSNGEPDHWHGFKTATGMWASFSPALLGQSEDIHEGATGQYSAVMTAKSAFGTIANGTMTNGRLNAGSTSATSTSNNASMSETYDSDFYMPLYAKPDQFKVWLKYQQGTANANNKANVSVKTFDGTYYQEPVDKTYTNLSGSIVGGEITACDWTQFTFPFDYASYNANHAISRAIFVTFSTNANPGQGANNDVLYVDDMELVYLAQMTDLRYRGVTIDGWDPAITTYNMEIAGEPNLNDFVTTFEGVSAYSTKSMEQNEDGSYRIAISVVSGDLQTATCYIINVTEPAGKPGDVDGNGFVNISDVTLLISYILGNPVTINEQNADMSHDTQINITDVTMLINYIMNN
jgi:hypothetical protein